MHLRSLRIRGFKSFPDTLEINLEPGVAVIVGPNGSGKSNIADAIVWAAGSLTPSELRAEKPDDVLFAGGGDRKAAEHCEVELVFDNEDGTWPDLDFSEVSIARRLVRGAEGQYLVNRAAVRRTDLVEILADVGLGSAMHSIVGQGKVEQVLASKAGGSARVRRGGCRAREVQAPPPSRRAEARARRTPGRARARRRGGGAQAPAAARAPGDGGGARREARPRDRGTARAGRTARSGRVGLAARGGGRAPRRGDVLEAGCAGEARGSARRSCACRGGALGRGGPPRGCGRGPLPAAGRGRAARAQDGVGVGAGRAVPRRDAGCGRARRTERPSRASSSRLRGRPKWRGAPSASASRSPSVRRSCANGCARSSRRSPSRRAFRPQRERFAEDGARLALAALDVEPGAERAVAAALRTRAAAVIADDPAVGLALLQRARAAGLGSLTVLAGRSPQDLVGEFPVVPLDALLEVTSPSVTPEGFGYDPARGELWFVGETAEAVLLELQGRRAALAAEAGCARGRGRRQRHVSRKRRASAPEWRRTRSAARPGSGPRRSTRRRWAVSSTSRRRFMAASTLRTEPPAGSRRRFARASTRARCGRASSARSCARSARAEVNLRRELEEASAAVTAAEVEIARIDADVADATRRLDSAGDVEAARGRRSRRARRARRPARRAPCDARTGQSARARGVRGREGASRRPEDCSVRISSRASRSSRSCAPS